MEIYFLLMSDSLSIGLAACRQKTDTSQGMPPLYGSIPFFNVQIDRDVAAPACFVFCESCQEQQNTMSTPCCHFVDQWTAAKIYSCIYCTQLIIYTTHTMEFLRGKARYSDLHPQILMILYLKAGQATQKLLCTSMVWRYKNRKYFKN